MIIILLLILCKDRMEHTIVPAVSSSSGIITSPHQHLRYILLVCLSLVPIQTGGSWWPFFRSLPAQLTVVSAGNILLTDAMKASVSLFNQQT